MIRFLSDDEDTTNVETNEIVDNNLQPKEKQTAVELNSTTSDIVNDVAFPAINTSLVIPNINEDIPSVPEAQSENTGNNPFMVVCDEKHQIIRVKSSGEFLMFYDWQKRKKTNPMLNDSMIEFVKRTQVFCDFISNYIIENKKHASKDNEIVKIIKTGKMLTHGNWRALKRKDNQLNDNMIEHVTFNRTRLSQFKKIAKFLLSKPLRTIRIKATNKISTYGSWLENEKRNSRVADESSIEILRFFSFERIITNDLTINQSASENANPISVSIDNAFNLDEFAQRVLTEMNKDNINPHDNEVIQHANNKESLTELYDESPFIIEDNIEELEAEPVEDLFSHIQNPIEKKNLISTLHRLLIVMKVN